MPSKIETLAGAIEKIDSEKQYSLKEIVAESLIPGVTAYSKIYSLTHRKIEDRDEKNNIIFKHVPSTETTMEEIKADSVEKAWNTKISGKLYVQGSEIIKFLNLNLERLSSSEA